MSAVVGEYDEATAMAIQAAMDEQEDAIMAQKLMESNRRGPMDNRQFEGEQMIDPATGVRAPDRQRVDQLIGGPQHEDMSDEDYDPDEGRPAPGFEGIRGQQINFPGQHFIDPNPVNLNQLPEQQQ